MKRESLIEAVSSEARDFIDLGTPKPQFVQTQLEKAEGKASPAPVPGPRRAAIAPAEKQEMPAAVPLVEQPADKSQSPVLVPQTFRLPQRLIEDLARAGELRALSWSGSRREYLTADKLKIYNAVKPSSGTDAYPWPDLDDRPKFKVPIIYEDSAVGKRAKHFYDRVIREQAPIVWNCRSMSPRAFNIR